MGKKNIIAFQGAFGAHSDLACREAYPYYDTLACPSFDDVIDAVESGRADYCMIPIENSNTGRVAEIHNLLPETSLHIVGEHFQKVEHCLLAPKGASAEDIDVVYSHPQALMQCKDNIKSLGIEPIAYSNTAHAAEDVAKWGDPSKGAVASKLAGEIHGLDIVKTSFEDFDSNYTLFVVMAKEPIDPSPKEGKVVTTLLFTARNIPAALYKALGGFATNQVNMVKIESYIPSGKSRMAQFFITFEGHPDDKNVQLALEELGFFCKRVKVLGVYYADEHRYG